jgi:hypothetical protein
MTNSRRLPMTLSQRMIRTLGGAGAHHPFRRPPLSRRRPRTRKPVLVASVRWRQPVSVADPRKCPVGECCAPLSASIKAVVTRKPAPTAKLS